MLLGRPRSIKAKPLDRRMVYRHSMPPGRIGVLKMRIVVLFLLCIFSDAAIAQADCRNILKANDRLACYDKISPPGALGKPATLKTPADSGQSVDPLAAENARTDKAVKNICRGC
jgi:hypothetical protein